MDKLPRARLDSIQSDFRRYIVEQGTQAGLETGLLHVLDGLQVSLRGLTAAHKLLILNLSLVVGLGVALFFYIFGKHWELNVWGDSWGLVAWQALAQGLSGLWLVQGTMLIMARISNSGTALVTAAVCAVLGFLVCASMYVVSVTMDV